MAIFGISRGQVKDIRAKRAKETLKQRREEEALERRRSLILKRAALAEAKAREKRAKEAAKTRWWAPPTIKVKVRKKKQSKKLNSKRRIGLI